MTGLESILIILKIGTPLIAVTLTAIGKFLWDIRNSSNDTKKEVHTLKEEIKTEITSLKFKVDNIDSKIKDYYSRAESDNRLLQLENKLTSKIYEVLNRKTQISRSKSDS